MQASGNKITKEGAQASAAGCCLFGVARKHMLFPAVTCEQDLATFTEGTEGELSLAVLFAN